MADAPGKPTISLFFPVYCDEATVRTVTEKARKVLGEVARAYEILIVDDGGPDRSGALADEMAARYPEVRVIHHPRTLGYGRALQSGLAAAGDFEWICFTDGDDQYDVRELYHMVRLLHRYDMLIGFRYSKVYSTWRMFLSAVYNQVLRHTFRSPFRDISCGLKLVRKSVVQDLTITSDSPFVGAEIVLKAMLRGYLIGEVGISTYPRRFGISTSTSLPNIAGTVEDLLRVRREVFSNRPR
jgi:glycosyltransferase involved in cell wall biosynthesis